MKINDGFLTVKLEGYIQQEKEARMIHALKDSAGDSRTKSYLPLYKQILYKEIITDMYTYMCVCSVAWLYPTLCDTMHWSLSVLCPWNFPVKDMIMDCHFSSRKSSQSRNQACLSCIPCIGWQVLCYSYLLLHNKLSKAWKFKKEQISCHYFCRLEIKVWLRLEI